MKNQTKTDIILPIQINIKPPMKHYLLKSFTLLLIATIPFVVTASELNEQLEQMLIKDQKYRTNNGQTSEQQALLDRQNFAQLKQIIAQTGTWPGIDAVGEEAAKIPLLVLKHASIKEQKELLPSLKAATLKGQIKPQWYAEVHDQWLMKQDLPQIYGTLHTRNKQDKIALYPLSNLQQIEHNRQAIGLPKLSHSLAEKDLWLRKNLATQSYELIEYPAFGRFAKLALSCIDQVYPNSVKHLFNSEQDVLSPPQMFPVFHGCWDWHSSVHGHWLLVKVAKMFPNHAPPIKARLAEHFTDPKIAAEVDYFSQPNRNSFERPYGMAWFLQLITELEQWDDPQAQQWRNSLKPLEKIIVNKLSSWIPKLSHPIRSGTHSQTAFAFGLTLDYAQAVGDQQFAQLLIKNSKRLYLNDKKCPINYEPSGHDFLSACLAEADLMRRILPQKQFSKWLKKFLPDIKHRSNWLTVVASGDPGDGHLAHLDGLNSSRAWMLEGIASALPPNDKRKAILLRQAEQHQQAGLAAVSDQHYEGSHWLGSFATYYLSQTGINH